MTGERALLHSATLHVSVVCKNKASHHKQRQLNCCFLSLFYFLSIIFAFVTNMPFIEAVVRLRICLISLRVLLADLAKLVILVQF